MRILIVDNSHRGTDLLFSAIGFLGFTADSVRSATEAIQCHLQKRYDLVMLSMNLPDYDICSTAQAIRQLERTESGFIPSLLCGLVTVYDAGIHKNCLKNGMDNCVPVPRSSLEAIDLLETLRKDRRRKTVKKAHCSSGRRTASL